MVKNLLANAGDKGSILGLRRSPGEGNGNTLQDTCLFLPGKSHGQEEPGKLYFMGSDMTEQLNTDAHTHTHTHTHTKPEYIVIICVLLFTDQIPTVVY